MLKCVIAKVVKKTKNKTLLVISEECGNDPYKPSHSFKGISRFIPSSTAHQQEKWCNILVSLVHLLAPPLSCWFSAANEKRSIPVHRFIPTAPERTRKVFPID